MQPLGPMKTQSKRAPPAVQEFLSEAEFGFVGVSRSEKAFSRQLFRAFLDAGYAPVPVHPEAARRGQSIDGIPAIGALAEASPPLRRVFLILRPEHRQAEVRTAIEAGVEQIWIHGPGEGPGAASEAVHEMCRQNEVQLVAGECPFMFLPGTSWIHRCHGAVRAWLQRWPRSARPMRPAH